MLRESLSNKSISAGSGWLCFYFTFSAAQFGPGRSDEFDKLFTGHVNVLNGGVAKF